MAHFIDPYELVNTLGAWKRRRGALYERLAESIAQALVQEVPASGLRLPSERTLAELLGVSRGTVVAAYRELAESGVVERRRGSGTSVRLVSPTMPNETRLRAPMFGSMVTGRPAAIDLSLAAPPLDDVVADLLAAGRDALRLGAPAHGYAPLGLPALRESLANLLSSWGAKTTSDQLLVTSGAQGALTLLVEALIRPGDSVVTEIPTYPGALELFSRAGARIVGVPRHHSGIGLQDMEAALRRVHPRIVFLMPTAHNPTGSVLSEMKGRQLLRVIQGSDAVLVEDLTLAGLVFDGQIPAPISAQAQDRVLAIGSISKTIWGGLRVGFVRGDPGMVLRLGRLKMAHDLGSGMLDQVAAVAALARADAILAARQQQACDHHDFLVESLMKYLPEWESTPCRGGWSLWIRVPGTTGDTVTAASLREGVAVSPGAAYSPDDSTIDRIRLSFVAPLTQLEEAVKRLKRAWISDARMAEEPSLV